MSTIKDLLHEWSFSQIAREPLDEHNLKEITTMLTKKTFEDKNEARKVISIS